MLGSRADAVTRDPSRNPSITARRPASSASAYFVVLAELTDCGTRGPIRCPSRPRPRGARPAGAPRPGQSLRSARPRSALLGRGRASRPLQDRRSVECAPTARQGPRRPTALAPLDITLALCLLARPRPGLRPGPPGALGRWPSDGPFLARVTRRAASHGVPIVAESGPGTPRAARRATVPSRRSPPLARVTRRAGPRLAARRASVASTPRATRRGLAPALLTYTSGARARRRAPCQSRGTTRPRRLLSTCGPSRANSNQLELTSTRAAVENGRCRDATPRTAVGRARV